MLKIRPHTLRTCQLAMAAAVTTLIAAGSADAALTAYYTLDNLSAGIQNLGSDGVTSNLSTLSVASTPAVVTGVIGSGALSFDGNDVIGAFTASSTPTSVSFTAGNAGADLTSYPFSMSVWMNLTSSSTGAAMGTSQQYSSNRYLQLGAAAGQPGIVRRNTTALSTNASGVSTGWHQVVGIFGGNQSTLIYVDGKLAVNDTTTNVGLMAASTLTLGGLYRGGSDLISTYIGGLDDAGLFNGDILTAADAALINGLGRTGAIGLDQLAAAQALHASAIGTIATIGGATWQRVSGLTGVPGDFGGTVSGGDAFIVTDAGGNGITLIPEPASLALLGLGGLMMVARRRGK